MAILEKSLEHAVALSMGCVWAAYGGSWEASHAIAVGAAGLIAVATAALSKVGVESNSKIAKVRRVTKTELQIYCSRYSDLIDLEEADKALAESLPSCFLDRESLAAAAVDPAGFPRRATDVVLASLAKAKPQMFGDLGPEAARDFARAVVSRCLTAVLEDGDYFKRLQPRLTIEEMKTLGILREASTRLEAKADAGLEILSRLVKGISEPFPAVDLHRIDTYESFNGTQRDFGIGKANGLYRAILQARDSAVSSSLGRLLQSLDFELPLPTERRLAEQQKYVLYGGYSPSLQLNFDPLEYVLAGLAFERKSALDLVGQVVNSTSGFEVYNLLGRPGQGTSLALAQVIRGLCNHSGMITFWSLGAHSVVPCDRNDHSLVVDLFKAMSRAGQLPQRVVFVFDDFSRRSDIGELLRLYGLAKSFAETEGANITFIVGASDPDSVLGAQAAKTVDLKLFPEDERRLYSELTANEPRIVEQRFPTVEDLLEAFPKARDYSNDIQSFIDFVISKSAPSRAFRPNWFSDISAENEAAVRAISVLGVSQMIDLPVPHRIAVGVLRADGVVTTEHQIARLSRRICKVDGNFHGFALTSAYRAQSLLRNVGLLTPKFALETLARLIDASFSNSGYSQTVQFHSEIEYARHIFQRLAKKEYYRMPELPLKTRLNIADSLFDQFSQRLVRVLGMMNDGGTYARWAGTLCALGAFRQSSGVESEPDGVAAIVTDLCIAAVRTDAAKVAADPRSANALLRAINRLLFKYPREKLVLAAAKAVKSIAMFENVVLSELDNGAIDAERRANILLLSYVRFLLQSPHRDLMANTRAVFALYRRMAREFEMRGLALDVGNNLERADSTIVNGTGDVESIALIAHCLSTAKQAVRSEAREQGTWSKHVQERVRRFEGKYGKIQKWAV